jgi:plasmid stabilization system protein ParE
MARFELTHKATQDLIEIEDYIAQDDPNTARRVILELKAAMQHLAEMPQVGHRRFDIRAPRYRFWNVHSYLIVYNPDTIPIQVIRVVHGKRDLPNALKE